MKRSSSKLIGKASSMRNINKLGYKFGFELHIESVDKMIGSNDVVVTWERREKVLSTKPAKIDRSSRVAHFGGEVLKQEITLFKKKKEGSNFQDKVYRLAVRQNSERGKIIGKIDLDFSEYVEIPSYSKRVGAPLSSGGRIVMRVVSKFLAETRNKKSSQGTGSVGSHDVESDGQFSTINDDDFVSQTNADIQESFDDIGIDDTGIDVPPPRPTLQANSRKPSNRHQRNPPAPEEAAPKGKLLRKISASPNNVMSGNDSSSRFGGSRIPRSRTPETDVGATNSAAPSRAEFEKLRRENRTLRRQNDDLLQHKESLERELEDSRYGDDAESLEKLMVENTALRRDVGDLEAKLAREPVYADVVRELREAKMALAILTLEKDELQQALRKLKRG